MDGGRSWVQQMLPCWGESSGLQAKAGVLFGVSIFGIVLCRVFAASWWYSSSVAAIFVYM